MKALAWKAGVRVKLYREFESHPLRHAYPKWIGRFWNAIVPTNSEIFIYFNGNWIRDFETHSASRTFSVNPA